MISDELLISACSEAENQLLDELICKLDEMSGIALKRKSKKRIKAFLKSLDKTYSETAVYDFAAFTKKYNLKQTIKAVLVAALIAILLTATCWSFENERGFFGEITDIGTFFTFNKFKDNDDYLFAEYTYIPEGYVLTSEERNKRSQLLEYHNNDLLLTIDTYKKNNSLGIFVNSENAETGEVPVNDAIGYYCINEDSTTLMWSTGNYVNVIMADNTEGISVDTLLKIALSRTKIK